MKRFAIALALVALVVLVAPMVLGQHPGTVSAAVIHKNTGIKIHPSAQLVRTGIDVTVIYTCAPTSRTDTAGVVDVHVSQGPNSGDSGPQPATCDRKAHATRVTVLGIFTHGPADVAATVHNDDVSAVADQLAAIMVK